LGIDTPFPDSLGHKSVIPQRSAIAPWRGRASIDHPSTLEMNQMLSRDLSLAALGCLTCLLLCGCNQNQPPSGSTSEGSTPATSDDAQPLVERVLTQEERDNLTPDDVLKSLTDGNVRFVSGTLTSRDHSARVREAALGQFPKAVILSCLDSRIPVEDVFDRGIGDVFVARVAGNFENTDILGSMEFACKVSGSKLIFVLGHEHCGAIKGAIDGVELGNITAMLANIQPAVDHFTDYEGDKSSANQEFVHMVAEQNVRQTIDRIREGSPILREMESSGEIKMVGGLYEMKSGVVEILPD